MRIKALFILEQRNWYMERDLWTIFNSTMSWIFHLALEKAQLQPDEVWYIGDQYESDVKGALNAGHDIMKEPISEAAENL